MAAPSAGEMKDCEEAGISRSLGHRIGRQVREIVAFPSTNAGVRAASRSRPPK